MIRTEEAYRDKVLNIYFEDGILTKFPAKQKKQIVILETLVENFEFDTIYDEGEVTLLLSELFYDALTLRRGFIDFRLMARDNEGNYWRI